MSKFLLAIDVGNSNITFGFFKNDDIVEKFRTITRKMSVDELGLWLTSAIEYTKFSFRKLDAVIVSCVVPSQTETIKKMSQKYLKCEPIFISAKEIKNYIPISYMDLNQIGSDRLANAAAIYGKYKSKVIIIDFGTATTFCLISPESEFLGGCIVPGFEISLNALYEKAEKLCPIDFKIPDKIIANNTADGICGGIFYGYCALVDGIIKRMLDEIGFRVRVIATGGCLDLLIGGIGSIDEVIPDLTLLGLKTIFKKKWL